ncbi:MAG: thiamine phosphate synthase [Pseudomonadota bacterium]
MAASSTQLYLISPPSVDGPEAAAAALEDCLKGGSVAAYQLRLKDDNGKRADRQAIIDVALAVKPVLAAHDVAFIINDDPELAQNVGADGVHIGQSDGSYADARKRVGDQATVGVTCHDSYHLALEAAEAGADYVAFGAFFETATKQASTRATLELLSDWTTMTTVPCVAIGGITPSNCDGIVQAGADFIAVSSAVWQAPSGSADAIKRFNEAFSRIG